MDTAIREVERKVQRGDVSAVPQLEAMLSRLAFTGDIGAALKLQDLLIDGGKDARSKLNVLQQHLLGKHLVTDPEKPWEPLWVPEKPPAEYSDDEIQSLEVYATLREASSYTLGGRTRYLATADVCNIARDAILEIYAHHIVHRDCKLAHNDAKGWHWVHPTGSNIEALMEAVKAEHRPEQGPDVEGLVDAL